MKNFQYYLERVSIINESYDTRSMKAYNNLLKEIPLNTWHEMEDDEKKVFFNTTKKLREHRKIISSLGNDGETASHFINNYFHRISDSKIYEYFHNIYTNDITKIIKAKNDYENKNKNTEYTSPLKLKDREYTPRDIKY